MHTLETDYTLLAESYEKKIFDLNQLIGIAKCLTSTLDFNQLIESVLHICMGQGNVGKAALFTRKHIDSQDFYLHRNHVGFDIERGKEYMLCYDHPVIELLSSAPAFYAVHEIEEMLMSEECVFLFKRLGVSYVLPMIMKNSIMGILLLGERIGESEFSRTEKDYLLQIASLAAIAVHNAFLYEMSTTDIMTMLKKRHYFLTALEEAMDEAHDKNLSVLMMDIDRFKSINDLYGHVFGHQVIKTIAKLIVSHIRQTDVAARYGGEEFIAMLPDTERNEAFVIGERIRHSVQQAEFVSNEERVAVTISIGIAQFNPLTDKNPAHLIERADKALYASKQNGKNCVTCED